MAAPSLLRQFLTDSSMSREDAPEEHKVQQCPSRNASNKHIHSCSGPQSREASIVHRLRTMAPPQAPTTLLLALLLGAAIATFFQLASSADPDPLQDIAVADLDARPLPNGYLARPTSEATIDDFITSALAKPGDTSDRKLKAIVTPAFVPQFPGLNTLGIGASRIDFEAGGLNPPHIHPRASEFFYLVSGGPLAVGFITSTTNPATNNPPNQLFNGTLYAGQGIVFPRALLHFQKNVGSENAFAIAAFNSQNPGVEVAARILFNAAPYPIASDILEQAFGVDAETIAKLVAYAERE